MIRWAENVVKRRKKISSEKVDYSGIQDLLNGVEGVTRINMDYLYNGCNHTTLKNAETKNVLSILEKKFKPSERFALQAKHDVYRGQRDEKHYLNLEMKEIDPVKNKPVMTSEYRAITLDFIINK